MTTSTSNLDIAGTADMLSEEVPLSKKTMYSLVLGSIIKRSNDRAFTRRNLLGHHGR